MKVPLLLEHDIDVNVCSKHNFEIARVPIHILTSRGIPEFTLIVNEIAKASYEYVHDLMSNG